MNEQKVEQPTISLSYNDSILLNQLSQTYIRITEQVFGHLLCTNSMEHFSRALDVLRLEIMALARKEAKPLMQVMTCTWEIPTQGSPSSGNLSETKSTSPDSPTPMSTESTPPTA